MILGIYFCLAAAVFSYLCTRAIRTYVIRKNVMDIPNERSSHRIPTPRGGGLAVAFTLACAVLAATAMGYLATFWLIPLTGCLIIAALGWCDDTRTLSAGLRLIVQIVISVAAILALQAFVFGHAEFYLGQLKIPAIPALVFFVLLTIWMTNLYNFMDGTDGILGTQTLTVATAAAVLCFRRSDVSELGFIYLLVAGSTAGFLILNWSPARIFMGDVGSACLGFLFGVLTFIGVATSELSLIALVVLHAAFIGDATITLFVRISRGKKPHQAHRSHFYQKMVQAGVTHRQVALIFAALNVLWLAPLAWLIDTHLIHPWTALALGCAPIVALAWWYKAGVDPQAVSLV